VGGTGLGWYDVDAGHGLFKEKGLVESLPCSRMVVSPDQKDLYLKTSNSARRKSVLAYHLAADGSPVRVGEAAGDGTDFTGLGFDSLKITPDGKFLYTIGSNAAIGRIQRRADGSIEYTGTTDLADVIKPLPRKHYEWVSLGITADSKWLYAYCEDYGPVTENFLAVFRRNLQTGELTLQESIFEDKDRLAGQRWAHLYFQPDGTSYLFSGYRQPMVFRVDPQSGRFVERCECPDRQAWSPAHVAFDADHGLFYGTTGGDGVPAWFFALKMESPPREQPKPGGNR
jgi:6-phosphogluconolactonase (cycloisomerase 2 family)